MVHSFSWPFSWQTGALAFAVCVTGASSSAQDPAKFDAPAELTAAGEPMRGIYYPSPTLQDLDGDGRRELLIGDLPGRIRVLQPGAQRGSTDWGEIEFLKAKGGKNLKLNNW